LNFGSDRSSRPSSSNGDRKGGGGATVIIMAPSRSRELLADAGSVELTKNPDAMISALRMIDNRGELRGGDLGRHGDVHRQSARKLRRPVFDPSLGGCASFRAGQIRRRR
jgi:hypothetical protein